MERKTLLAIVLVLLVLAGNQVLFNQYMRAKRKNAPPPATEQAPGAGTVTGGAQATGVPPAAGTGGTGGAPPAPEGSPTAEDGTAGILKAGGPATGLRSVPAPHVERTLAGDGFQATLD